MFFAFHKNSPAPTDLVGLREVFSDGSATFYHPPKSMSGFQQGETAQYYYQFFGNIQDACAGNPNYMETLAREVEEGNISVLLKLNGSFLGSFYNKTTKRLSVLSDRWGSVRSFIGQKENLFCHFPRLSFFNRVGFQASYTTKMALQLLAFRYIASGSTPLEGTKRMSPGSVITFAFDGEVRRLRYWDLTATIEAENATHYQQSLTETQLEEYAIQYGDIWLKAVEKCLPQEGNITIPLSGGIDSRAILSAVIRLRGTRDLQVCTFGTRGTLDFEIPHFIANKLNLRHLRMPILWNHDFSAEWMDSCLDSDGCIDCTNNFFPSHWRQAAEFSNLFFVGFIGDHINGSHLAAWMIEAGELGLSDDRYCLEKCIFERQIEVPLAMIHEALGITIAEARKIVVDIVNQTMILPNKPSLVANRCMYWDYFYRQRTFIGPAVQKLQGEIFYHAPFLDNEISRFLFALPFDARLHSKVYYRMLMQQFPTTFSFPTSNFGGISLRDHISPSRITKWRTLADKATARIRPLSKVCDRMDSSYRYRMLNKTKFIDFGSASRVKSGFRDHLMNMVNNAMETDLVDKSFLSRRVAEHLRGSADHSRMLLGVANIGVFSRCFS